MRILVGLVVAAALLWAGYWVIGSQALDRGATAWFEDRRTQGWVAQAEVAVQGFPNRFDLTLTDVELADPRTGLAWSAPFFQTLALSYQPNHIIAVWPDTQTLQTPDQRIAVTSTDLRGSVVFEPGTRLALERATFQAEAVALTSTAPWTAGLEAAQLAARQTPGVADDEHSYDLSAQVDALQLADTILARLDPRGRLPETITALTLRGTVVFDRPWDRFAIENGRPQPIKIDLENAHGSWGQLDLRAAGALSVDTTGRPDGTLSIRAENWREMIALAVDAGFLPEGMAQTVENAMGLLAGLSGNPETLETDLTFQNGLMFFGPIPLGPAPLIRLR